MITNLSDIFPRDHILSAWDRLWNSNKKLALQFLFYTFDAHAGRNMKLTFYYIMAHLYKHHPTTFYKNLSLIIGVPNKYTYDKFYIIKKYYSKELQLYKERLVEHVSPYLHASFIQQWKENIIAYFKYKNPLPVFGNVVDLIGIYCFIRKNNDSYLNHTMAHLIINNCLEEYFNLPSCFRPVVLEKIIKESCRENNKNKIKIKIAEKKYNDKINKFTFEQRYFYISV